MFIGARFIQFFKPDKLLSGLLRATEIIRKQILDLRIKSRLLSPKRRNVVYACLKYPSSAIFPLEGDLFLFLGIIYSTLHHQFVISGSVTGRAIFLSMLRITASS